MKIFSVIFCNLLIILLVLINNASSQEDMKKIEKIIDNAQRSSVSFVHDSHNEKAGITECNICHHVYKNGIFLENESSEDRGCSDCHSLKSKGRTPSLMNAYHLNCKGCHMQKKAGPILCGECHLNK